MTITDVINEAIDIAAAATEEDLYEIPAGKHFSGKIRATNRDTATIIDVVLAPLGAATDDTMYFAQQTPIGDHDNWERRAVLPGETVIRVTSGALDVTFRVMGFLFTT